MDHVTRINLKTDCDDRSKLIDFCLNGDKQFLAIGWSYIYEKGKKIKNFEDFYYAVKEDVSRINHDISRMAWNLADGNLCNH